MRLFIFLSLFSLAVYGAEKPFGLKKFEREPKTVAQVTSIVVRYTRERLMDRLHGFLMSGRPSRFFSSSGHLKARQQIIDTIPNHELLSLENFSLSSDHLKKQFQSDAQSSDLATRTYAQGMLNVLQQTLSVQGQNIVWEKKGTQKPEEVLLIGAHYDTIGIDPKTMEIKTDTSMPGADHNGTGVAAALALIEVLNEVTLPRTVRVIFFDAESIGKSGSNAYVQKHKEELSRLKPQGFVNLLMLGHDTLKDDKLQKTGNMCFYTRDHSFDSTGAQLDKALAQRLISGAKEVRSSVAFEARSSPDLMSSQVAFQELGIGSVVMTHDWENDFNKALHTPQDFAETLNLATFHASTQYLMGAVLAWAFDIR